MTISVVSPVYNEEGNVRPLYEELKEVLEDLNQDYEIIFVDDGSEDNSFKEMREIAEEEKRFRVIKFRKNFGQSAALQAGFDAVEGEVVVSLDSDLQNDPRDIPKLLDKLDEGYDCVVGWRHEREDPIGKRLFSAAAAGFRKLMLGTELHDYGCTLKAFKRECIDELSISGEMHRYIPPLLRWRGFDVTEVKVNHREREHGETKYGSTRLFKGFMDMINVWFWKKFHGRPLHFFGGLGLISISGGVIAALVALYFKIFRDVTFSDTPLPLVSIFMVLVGILLFVFGLLADVQMKNYFSLQDRRVYSVEEELN